MSPWTKFADPVPYWTSSGRSTPSVWLSASTARWSANGPSMARPTLPGSTWPPRNTMTLSRNSVTSDSDDAPDEEGENG